MVCFLLPANDIAKDKRTFGFWSSGGCALRNICQAGYLDLLRAELGSSALSSGKTSKPLMGATPADSTIVIAKKKKTSGRNFKLCTHDAGGGQCAAASTSATPPCLLMLSTIDRRRKPHQETLSKPSQPAIDPCPPVWPTPVVDELVQHRMPTAASHRPRLLVAWS